MKKLIHLIMGSLFIGLCTACTSSTRPIASQLEEAEQLTWTHPDSALQIVQSIPHPEKLTGKEQADYALLLSHLQYRCDVPFTSDSLVNIAWAYYKNSDDKNKRGKAWYMKGTVLEEFENKIPEALTAYLQAEDCISDMTDRYLPGRIYRCIGLIHKNTQNYDLAIECYKKALDIDFRTNDIDGQIWDWLNLSGVYSITKKIDSIRWVLNQMLQLEADIQDSVVLAKVYHNVAVGKLQLGDSTQVENLFLQALKLTPHNPSYKTLSELAQIYLRQGRDKQADELFEQVLEKANLPTKATVYGALYREALSNKKWEKATHYADTFIDIQEEYYIQNRHKETLEIQEKYDYMKVLYQKAEMKNRFYLIILLLIGVIGIAFYAFRLYVKRMKKHYLLLQAEIGELKYNLSEAQNTGKCQAEEIQKLQTELAEKEKEASVWNNRIHVLTKWNVTLISAENARMMEVILTLLEKRTCNLKKDRIYIRKWMVLTQNKLMDELSQTCSRYKEKQIDICCLMLLGFSIAEVAQLMDITVHTLERYMSYFCRDNHYPGKGKTGFLAFLNTHTLITDEKSD